MPISSLSLNCSGTIFFGPTPEMEEIEQLKTLGVTVIWNLLMEFPEISQLEKNFFPKVINSPIQDGQSPEDIESFRKDLEKIAAYLKLGHNVYIHCLGGHGRTGLALAALMISIDYIDPDIALEKTQTICSGPETQLQKEFIRQNF